MEKSNIVIIVFSSFAVLMYLLVSLSAWSIHKSQVRKYCDDYGKGSFDDFKAEYKKRDWGRDKYHENSHFGTKDCRDKNEIHASIIKFNGIGMQLDYISYMRFSFWVLKNKKRGSKQRFNDIKSDSKC